MEPEHFLGRVFAPPGAPLGGPPPGTPPWGVPLPRPLGGQGGLCAGGPHFARGASRRPEKAMPKIQGVGIFTPFGDGQYPAAGRAPGTRQLSCLYYSSFIINR